MIKRYPGMRDWPLGARGISLPVINGGGGGFQDSLSGGGGPVLPTVRSVANRSGLPNQTGSATDVWVLAETSHILCSDVSGQIEIWWPNFYVNSGGPNGGAKEISLGAAATATAQLIYTDPTNGATVVNLLDKVGGTTALSAADGNWFKAVVTIAANKGTRIRPRIRANFPNGWMFQLFHADIANGDKIQFGTSVPALTSAPINSFVSGSPWYGPALIAAASSAPSAGIVGDSREVGLYDFPSDAFGDSGQLSRLFGRNSVAYIVASAGGETAQEFSLNTGNARRRELMSFATFTAIGLGVNDASSRTGAQIDADVTTIINSFGLPAIVQTVCPFTKDGITTPISAGHQTNRSAYNTLVRARSVYYDPAGILENSGAWRCYDSVWVDYLHNSNIGNDYAAQNAALIGTTVGVHGIAARSAGSNKPDANLITAPTDFSNAAYSRTNATIANAGTTTQQIIETIATGNHNIAQTKTKAASALTYRMVLDVKSGLNRDWIDLAVFNSGFSSGITAYYNVTTGAVGSLAAFPGGVNSLSSLFQYIFPLSGNANTYAAILDFLTDTDTGLNLIPAVASADGTNSYLGIITNGMQANNFRVFPIPSYVASAYSSTWDPAKKASTITLANDNYDATNPSGTNNQSVLGTTSKSTGKFYFEVLITGSNAASGAVGVGNASANTNSWTGSDGNSVGVDLGVRNVFMNGGSQGASGISSAILSGDVIGACVDRTGGKIYFSRNGTFGTGIDPVAGTGGYNIPAGAVFPMEGVYQTNQNAHIRTALFDFLTPPPSGFAAWG